MIHRITILVTAVVVFATTTAAGGAAIYLLLRSGITRVESAEVIFEREVYRKDSMGFLFSSARLPADGLAGLACAYHPFGRQAVQRTSTSCMLSQWWKTQGEARRDIELPGVIVGLSLFTLQDGRLGAIYVSDVQHGESQPYSVFALMEPFNTNEAILVSHSNPMYANIVSGIGISGNDSYVVWSDSPKGAEQVYGRMIGGNGEVGEVSVFCGGESGNCGPGTLIVLPTGDVGAVLPMASPSETRLVVFVPGRGKLTQRLDRHRGYASVCGASLDATDGLHVAWLHSNRIAEWNLVWNSYETTDFRKKRTVFRDQALHFDCTSPRLLSPKEMFLVLSEQHRPSGPDELSILVTGLKGSARRIPLVKIQRLSNMDAFPREDGSIDLLTRESHGQGTIVKHRIVSLSREPKEESDDNQDR